MNQFIRRKSVIPIIIMFILFSMSLATTQAQTPLVPKINEFVFNHDGADTNAFIEIFGSPDTDYSSYTVIEIEGDGSGAGVIDAVLPVGTTSSEGYWVDNEDVENATVTLLLVEGFTGSQSMDIDTDNDGIADITPWTAIVDAIAVTDGQAGDQTYANVELAPGFDGGSFTVGGASRIPNGIDTDTTSDWVRNDFDLAGFAGEVGTPESGEALNTPNAVNQAVPTGPIATDPLINEFVFNHTGSDNTEYIEILGDPNADYSAFSVIVIEGDSNSSNLGNVVSVDTLGTTDSNGYHLLGFFNDRYQNGSQTILLVENYTGLSNEIVDTDDNGTLDIMPWDRIVDDFAITDGGASDLVYSSVVLDAGFDGGSFTVGGASRIPNGVDTDSPTDWVRNDFDLAGIPNQTGTPQAGEAFNTPAAINDVVPVDPSDIDPIINEFVFNHTGSDTTEYVEILGDSNADYSAFSMIVIEGDSNSSNLGNVISVDPLGTTDGNGYQLLGFFSNRYQNGSQTILLVENYTGLSNEIVDTDDNGTLDIMPWDRIVDDFAITDDGAGDLVYSTVVLDAGFDGGSFTVGGASRIPNGVDTDTSADWLRNDFELEGIPGQTGTPQFGEALNTPGADNVAVEQPPVQIAKIYEIQGAGHTSPYVGSLVSTTGIVTAIDTFGNFWIQDPIGDGNTNTSDGILVFNPANIPQEGDEVEVIGIVVEYANDADDLTLTEFAAGATVNILSNSNILPAPVILGIGGRTIPNVVIDDDNLANFDPNNDGMDFYESVEGMLVRVNSPRIVASRPAGGFAGFGERAIVADNGAGSNSSTPRGGLALGLEGTIEDLNPELMLIDEAITGVVFNVTTGDLITDVVGPMTYNFSTYKIAYKETPSIIAPSTITPEITSLAGEGDTLTVASYNVLNLDPSDGIQFNELGNDIASALNCPDILAVQEIQDNNGEGDDGSQTTDASQTYALLLNAIHTAGCTGPYDYRDIAPLFDQDGGAPGSNIRVGFIFNTARVEFVDRGNGGANDPTSAVIGSDGVELSLSPGKVDPANPAYDNSRKPLAGEFKFNNQSIFVINVHFSSKSGDEALYGVPPQILAREGLRTQQAQSVANLVSSILSLDSNANVVVLGDTNEFYFRPPVAALESAGLINLWYQLPENERYNYEFNNYDQNLDNLLVSNSLLSNLIGFDVVHINAEFQQQTSDHDPLIAAFNVPFQGPKCNGIVATVYVNDGVIVGGQNNGQNYVAGRTLLRGTNGNDIIVGTEGNDRIRASNGDDLICGGNGDDLISGENGNDTIFGEDGNDILDGSNGNDIISGGNGNDVILGRNSNDTLSGDAGNDTVIGGEGDDIISGGDSNDLLSGDGGQDNISGESGDDTIIGGNGDDILNGGDDNDLINGNSGQDTIHGENGDDYILGGSGDDDIFGGDGDDTLIGLSGNDFIDGEADNDKLFGNQGDDLLEGGDGQDTLYGGSNNDRLFGENDDDVLLGNSGDDQLDGGDGNDRCNGGVNNDTANACEIIVSIP